MKEKRAAVLSMKKQKQELEEHIAAAAAKLDAAKAAYTHFLRDQLECLEGNA